MPRMVAVPVLTLLMPASSVTRTGHLHVGSCHFSETSNMPLNLPVPST